MMDMQIGRPEQIVWIWLVAVVALVAVAGLYWRRKSLLRFATGNLLPHLFPANLLRRQTIRSAVVIASMFLLTIAALDIRWGKQWQEVPQRGIDVVFALDVSRSMLAEDVAPNRLQRAKEQIKDMMDAMPGDRVGLVVFAGDSRRVIPLTRHYVDFKNRLEEVGPYDVTLGGSQLARALETAADTFLDKTGDHRAIVVFSDGEDQGSEPVDVARKIYREQGIRIYTVGLGDPNEGALVPAPEGSRQKYMTYDGQPVRSRLHAEVLKQIALEADGAYVPAETRWVDMADVYRAFVASIKQQEFETARINAYVPRYQIFVGAALLLIATELLWPQRRQKAHRGIVETLFRDGRKRKSRSRPENQPRPEQDAAKKKESQTERVAA